MQRQMSITMTDSSGSTSASTSSGIADIVDPLSNTALLRILECPVCFEVPLPPIFQCVKGHNVCSTCRPKLVVCALCRGKFSETRNYAVEQIIASSNHSCPFKLDGCEVVLNWDSMRAHTNTCSFRPLRCPMLHYFNCENRGLKILEMKDHLIDAHNAVSYEGATHNISHVFLTNQIDNDGLQIQFAYKPCIFQFMGKHFWATAFKLNHMVHWTVLCLDTKEESQKFLATVVLEPLKIPSIQWTIPVNPIEKGAEHVYMDPPSSLQMFNPSCSIADFKKFAELSKLENGTQYYCFLTSYTISVKEGQS